MDKIKKDIDSFVQNEGRERGWNLRSSEKLGPANVVDPRDSTVRQCGGIAYTFHNNCVVEVTQYMESFLNKEGQVLGIYQRGVLPNYSLGLNGVVVRFFMK